MSVQSFWPPSEAAQVDYEALRSHTLDDSEPPEGLIAARFHRRGLAGLIAWPSAEPVFLPALVGAERPPWTPHLDPRVSVLAASYQFLLEAAVELGTAATGAPPVGLVRR